MTKKFLQNIPIKGDAYDPLRFMASDFFVSYWNYFAPLIPDQFTSEIQKAARICVDHFMDQEEIFWLISFEEKYILKTWELFEKQISNLPRDVIELTHHLSLQIMVPEEESNSADFFIGLINRLRFDYSYRKKMNYRDEDANILDAAYEYSADKLLDLGDIKDDWLDANSFWDKKLKSQTPDLPESIYVIFSTAYNPNSCLVQLHDNFHLLLNTMEIYNNFINRLEKVFIAELPNEAKIEFPRLMRV
jgi:hypothetical protein